MQIIQVVKKGKNDVTVLFENDQVLFLTLEVFLKSGLKKGDNISEDRFSFLIEQNKLFHIRQKAFRLLGRRQHSSFELRRKLWNKDYEQKLIDEVIEELKQSGYLNDKEFISAFVADKNRAKNWGSKKLKGELRKRGLASKIIDEELNSRPKSDDYESAVKSAEKKYKLLLKRNTEPKVIRNKLSAYLFSKGFDYDIIKQVCNKLLKSKSDEQ